MFNDFEEMHRLVDDPNLDIDEDCVMVLKNAGPKGGPGMPEWGHLPIPKKLAGARHFRHLVRISDARMSGTAYGTAILHMSPESAVGGPFAAVQTGDRIELDVRNRRLTLKVEDREIARRFAAWKPGVRGRHGTRADTGTCFSTM